LFLRATPAIAPKSDPSNAKWGYFYFTGALKFVPTPAIALNSNLQ